MADPDDYVAQGRLRLQGTSGAGGAAAPIELRFRRKDGSELWTESTGRTIVGSDGAVVASFALHRDVTAQKQARLELELQREQADAALHSRDLRLTGLIESAMDAVISIDEQHEIVLFNAAAEKMFGHEAAAVMGRKLAILIPPRLRASHDTHIEGFQRPAIAQWCGDFRRRGVRLEVLGFWFSQLRRDRQEVPPWLQLLAMGNTTVVRFWLMRPP